MGIKRKNISWKELGISPINLTGAARKHARRSSHKGPWVYADKRSKRTEIRVADDIAVEMSKSLYSWPFVDIYYKKEIKSFVVTNGNSSEFYKGKQKTKSPVWSATVTESRDELEELGLSPDNNILETTISVSGNSDAEFFLIEIAEDAK